MCEIEIKVNDCHKCIDKFKIDSKRVIINPTVEQAAVSYFNKDQIIMILPIDIGKRIEKYIENGSGQKGKRY